MFVAIVPPEPVLEDLEAFVAPRRDSAPFRWTLPGSWHVTLAFIEDVPDRSYDDLVDRLARAVSRRSPTSARLVGGGAFPHVGRAKLLWTGIETDQAELERAAIGVRSAASTAGVEVDGAHFRPHVTLARMGRPVEATRWVRVLDAYAGPSWRIDEVELVASYLGEGPRGRPRYESVATFAMGG